MTGFLDATLAFPTALFSFLLLVAIGYWVVVVLSIVDADPFDGAGIGDVAAALSAVGLGGVPVTVVLTVLIAFAWFLSLAGNAATGSMPVARLAVLPAALVGAWLGTRSVVVPMRRLLPDNPAPSRLDFVGRACVVRTGEVSSEFGQAEVTADDGSTAIIQVRLTGYAVGTGWVGLIYDYDTEREAFWITPADPAV